MNDPSVAVVEPSASQSNAYWRRRFTVKECVFLSDNGLLQPGKFELLEGDIVFKMGQGYSHMLTVSLLLEALTGVFGIQALRVQAGVGIGESDEFNDPEPDVTVLRGKARDYRDRSPDPVNEILMVAEASDSTVAGDLTVKSRIYARHGICEYWVVDIRGRRLIVFRDPQEGAYQLTAEFDATAAVSPLAAPHAAIRVADLLP